jgi:predicted transcriptional regulator of viral defense system
MTSTVALAKLLDLGMPAFTTSDAGACLDITAARASKLLARLTEAGHMVSLGRGLWAFPDRLEPLALPGVLTSPFPAYVSLQSALYYHGIISQMPSVLYAVSLARTKVYSTPLGTVSVHHVAPTFFFDSESLGQQGARIATPEKALLDVLYLSPAKTRLFAALPDVELPDTFGITRARRIIKRIPSQQRRTLVQSRFDQLLSG